MWCFGESRTVQCQNMGIDLPFTSNYSSCPAGCLCVTGVLVAHPLLISVSRGCCWHVPSAALGFCTRIQSPITFSPVRAWVMSVLTDRSY